MNRFRHAALMAFVSVAACSVSACRAPGADPNTGRGAPGEVPPAQAAHGPADAAHGAHHGADPAGPPVPASGDLPQYPSNVAMAARLAQITLDIPPDPRGFESAKLLDALLAGGVPADPQQQAVFGFQIAVAQLNSGRLEEAAASFQRLQSALRQTENLSDSANLRQITSLLAVTWLRSAETRNCALNHNADSCILPIKDGGVHKDTEAVDRAIPELTALVRSDPDDLTSRWLLNVAHMARGTWPDGIDERHRIDPSVFEAEDDIGRFVDIAPALGFDVAGRAGGVVVDDFTGDGNLDVLSSGWGPEEGLHFFVSGGDGTFEDRAAAAGLTGINGGLNMVQADYDGDGWLDVLVLRGAWRRGQTIFPNSLLRNRGDGTFEDVTEAAGMLSYHPTQTGAWSDFDGDGDLDLFVGNETTGDGNAHPNELWRNDGDSTFTDIARQTGLDIGGFTKAAVWGDYDNDGRPDLFLSHLGAPNALFHNDGPGEDGGWRFSNRTTIAGVAEPIISFPAWWWDYDNDGWLDLLVSGYGSTDPLAAASPMADIVADYLGQPNGGERLRLYHNNGDGTFENVAPKAGVDGVFMTMGSNHGDLDNDGWDDFYLGTGNPDFRTLDPSRMFRNVGDGTFRDITTSGGFGNLQKGHGIAFADLDNDGDQDVYADYGGAYEADWYPNALYENPGHGNHWVTLRLRGRGANPSAIGARVAVRVATPRGSRTLHRLVGSGGSFGANSLQVELGLGDATAVEGVAVIWPGGEAEAFTGIGIDSVWTLTAGAPAARPVAQAAFKLGGAGPAVRAGR
jgi:hypothetical protein